ncbi:hypothetical protein [Thermomonospora umbrina]|uniref:hypothetical protein n=1 Tax=Thermomonospora umbrina TaxID=111806 RepID=UPI000E288BCF|nr:hypothetical protein [Thermomonospora umbrina]
MAEQVIGFGDVRVAGVGSPALPDLREGVSHALGCAGVQVVGQAEDGGGGFVWSVPAESDVGEAGEGEPDLVLVEISAAMEPGVTIKPHRPGWGRTLR